jgi:hypothetical protein
MTGSPGSEMPSAVAGRDRAVLAAMRRPEPVSQEPR